MTDESWINQAREMYENGKKYYQIANELGINRKTVSIKLRELGYQSDKRYVRNISPKKLKKYNYSTVQNIFSKIDTEEKAYWLGFLYADGYISYRSNIVSLALAEKDLNHLEKYRNFLGMEEKPFTKKIKNKTFVSYEFSICDQKVKDDLCKLGCIPRKTFELQFPTNDIVPDVFKKDFVRGYIDGDGCITQSTTSFISLDIVGTQDFLDGYQKWTNLKYNQIHSWSNTKIKHSVYSGFAAIQILDRIYKDSTVFLQRKYNKYLQLRRLRMNSVKRPKTIMAELSTKDEESNVTLKALLNEAAKVQ